MGKGGGQIEALALRIEQRVHAQSDGPASTRDLDADGTVFPGRYADRPRHERKAARLDLNGGAGHWGFDRGASRRVDQHQSRCVSLKVELRTPDKLV